MIKCLNCGSEQISPKIILGDANHQPQTIVECLQCGNEWNPKDYNRLQNEARQRAANRKYEAWKASFYHAVESNDMNKAADLMDEYQDLKSKFPSPKDAYEYLKKKDKMSNYIIIGVLIIVVLGVLFLIGGFDISHTEN